MIAFSRKTALLLARGGALVLALGVVSWFVWNAQVRARPDPEPDAGAADGEEEITLSPEELEELMMHSSKSFSPTDITIKEGPAPKADSYLPSTKSLFPGAIKPQPGNQDPAKPPVKDEKAKRERAEDKKPAKKKRVWLPSSKSLPPQEIPLPESPAKDK